MDQYVDWTVIRSEINKLIQSRHSGTILIATQDNAMCRLGLSQGRITHCTYKRVRGHDALVDAATISRGKFSVIDSSFPFRPADEVDYLDAEDLLHLNQPVPTAAETQISEPRPKAKYYRGQLVVDPGSPLPPAEPKKRSFFYRGQATAQPTAEPEKPKEKKQRFYRGQPIDD